MEGKVGTARNWYVFRWYIVFPSWTILIGTHDCTTGVRFIADDRGEFTSGLGLLFDATGLLGSPRSKVSIVPYQLPTLLLVGSIDHEYWHELIALLMLTGIHNSATPSLYKMAKSNTSPSRTTLPWLRPRHRRGSWLSSHRRTKERWRDGIVRLNGSACVMKLKVENK